MAPVLFLFLMMAFPEILEDKRTYLGLSKSKFACRDNSSRSTRKLVSHLPGTFKTGTLFYLFYMLYVDDSVFSLNPGLTLKDKLTSSPTTSPGLALKLRLAQETIPEKLSEYYSHLQVSSMSALHLPLTSIIPHWPSIQNKRETYTYTQGRRIHTVQRNSNHKTERRICHLHQEL